MYTDRPYTIEDFHREYRICQAIGGGKFGEVFKVQHITSKTFQALKIITCKSERDSQDVLQEIQIMEQLDHPNIVKLLKFYRENYVQNRHNPLCNYGLVMELGECSLERVLPDQSYLYSVVDVRRFLANLIAVGAYLQSKTVVHRDIKPQNIIIFGDFLAFKLADFGLACHSDRRPYGFAGTPEYCSPLLKQYYHSRVTNKRPPSDAFKDQVYSVGVTVDEVLKAIRYIWHRQHDDPNNQNFNFVMGEMLKREQRQRPTFSDLMRSHFVHQELQIPEAPPGKLTKLKQKLDEGSKMHQPVTVKKMQENNEMQMQCMTELQRELINYTEVRRPTFRLSQKYFELDFNIRTVCRLSLHYILCGDDQGQIIVYDCYSLQASVLNLKHGSYVSKIKLDDNGDIWTAGGDGLIYFFNRQVFLSCIDKKTVTKNQKIKNFYQVQFKVTHEIIIDPQDYELIHKVPNKIDILTFQCLDERHFVIAYADGTTHITWGNKENTYHNHYQIITKIKIIDDMIYTAFYQGIITRFDLKSFTRDNFLFTYTGPILDFKFINHQTGTTLEFVTFTGIQKAQIKNSMKYHTYQKPTKRVQKRSKGILGACEVQGDWFLLSQEGKVFDRQQQLLQSPMGRGWNSIQYRDGWLLGGSEQGMLMLLQLQKRYQ